MGQLLSRKQLVSEQGLDAPAGKSETAAHQHSAPPRAGVACVAVVLCWAAKAGLDVGLRPLFSVVLL